MLGMKSLEIQKCKNPYNMGELMLNFGFLKSARWNIANSSFKEFSFYLTLLPYKNWPKLMSQLSMS